MSHRLSAATILATGALLPSVAHAHGEQILLLPLGQLITLVAVGYIAIRKIVGGAAALLTFSAALLVAVATWALPGSSLALTDTEIFLLGLLPPMAAAILVAVAFRRFGRKVGRA